jgi:hypothetical protein
MEKNDVEHVLYVYYLDDNNNSQWEKIICDSPIVVEQMLKKIPERGFIYDVYVSEYKDSISVKRYIPYHKILHIDYVEFKK